MGYLRLPQRLNKPQKLFRQSFDILIIHSSHISLTVWGTDFVPVRLMTTCI